MSEPALAWLRIGKGYYEWTFEQQARGVLQVVAMHIHIERMDAIDDADAISSAPRNRFYRIRGCVRA